MEELSFRRIGFEELVFKELLSKNGPPPQTTISITHVLYKDQANGDLGWRDLTAVTDVIYFAFSSECDVHVYQSVRRGLGSRDEGMLHASS